VKPPAPRRRGWRRAVQAGQEPPAGDLHALGGRAPVRATLSMRALVAVRYQPVRTAFSQRLCRAGTAK
jgi:hypothetical protein